jgi:hypothetical protein
MGLTAPASIIIAGILIAVAIAVTNHWDFVSRDGASYRLNKWTGEIVLCTPQPIGGRVMAGMGYACDPTSSKQ